MADKKLDDTRVATAGSDVKLKLHTTPEVIERTAQFDRKLMFKYCQCLSGLTGKRTQKSDCIASQENVGYFV